jgi:nitroimidazol reductase NimA-like FMN-containing flavoprotein (pyridoxamine 5'-phosphate oxidase superfamily)
MTDLVATDRTRLRRKADRGRFDRDTIEAILDEAYIAHVSFVVDGQPWLIPMTYGRVGDHLYLHGARANHLLKSLAGGAPVCAAVTLLDGLVLARSVFHHSMNYRSVVIFGFATEVDDPAEKRAALDAVVDHVWPGRTATARPPTDSEVRATLVVKLPITEASAKVRTGPPIEEPDDLALEVWGGVVPVTTLLGEPVPDGQGVPDLPPPDLVRRSGRI